jgi:serine/threonine protein kinase
MSLTSNITNGFLERFYNQLEGKFINNDNKQKYLLKKIIGCGIHSCVYLGIDSDDNEYAIKIIKYSENNSELICNRFMNKENFVSKLLVDFIIEINNKNYYVLVNEYLREYITLKTFLEKYKDELNNIYKINKLLKDIKRILEIIHNKGFAHMDFHKENIMIHPDTMEIKIIDFGEAICKANEDDKLFDKNLFNIIQNDMRDIIDKT